MCRTRSREIAWVACGERQAHQVCSVHTSLSTGPSRYPDPRATTTMSSPPSPAATRRPARASISS